MSVIVSLLPWAFARSRRLYPCWPRCKRLDDGDRDRFKCLAPTSIQSDCTVKRAPRARRQVTRAHCRLTEHQQQRPAQQTSASSPVKAATEARRLSAVEGGHADEAPVVRERASGHVCDRKRDSRCTLTRVSHWSVGVVCGDGAGRLAQVIQAAPSRSVWAADGNGGARAHRRGDWSRRDLARPPPTLGYGRDAAVITAGTDEHPWSVATPADPGRSNPPIL